MSPRKRKPPAPEIPPVPAPQPEPELAVWSPAPGQLKCGWCVNREGHPPHRSCLGNPHTERCECPCRVPA